MLNVLIFLAVDYLMWDLLHVPVVEFISWLKVPRSLVLVGKEKIKLQTMLLNFIVSGKRGKFDCSILGMHFRNNETLVLLCKI